MVFPLPMQASTRIFLPCSACSMKVCCSGDRGMLGGVGMGDSLSFVFFSALGMYVVAVFGGDSLGLGR